MGVIIIQEMRSVIYFAIGRFGFGDLARNICDIQLSLYVYTVTLLKENVGFVNYIYQREQAIKQSVVYRCRDKFLLDSKFYIAKDASIAIFPYIFTEGIQSLQMMKP